MFLVKANKKGLCCLIEFMSCCYDFFFILIVLVDGLRLERERKGWSNDWIC